MYPVLWRTKSYSGLFRLFLLSKFYLADRMGGFQGPELTFNAFSCFLGIFAMFMIYRQQKASKHSGFSSTTEACMKQSRKATVPMQRGVHVLPAPLLYVCGVHVCMHSHMCVWGGAKMMLMSSLITIYFIYWRRCFPVEPGVHRLASLASKYSWKALSLSPPLPLQCWD